MEPDDSDASKAAKDRLEAFKIDMYWCDQVRASTGLDLWYMRRRCWCESCTYVMKKLNCKQVFS